MSFMKYFADMNRPRLRLLDGPAPARSGSFWQRARPRHSDQRAPLPEVGELVRLQTGAVSDLGVYFASVRSLGPKRIVVQLEDPAAAGALAAEASTAPMSNRSTILVSYDRGEALYHFQTYVIGEIRDSQVSLSRPREVTRVQRRNYYRLPLQSPTTFRLLEPDEWSISSAPMAARLVNLSGGGAMLSTNKPIPAGTRALVRVPTGKDGSPLDVVAETLDCRSTNQGRTGAYLIRFRFSGAPTLSQEDRESIISYIYEQQRILLRLRRMFRQTA